VRYQDQLVIGRNAILLGEECDSRMAFDFKLIQLEIAECTDHSSNLS
jgi:hypothetical protein